MSGGTPPTAHSIDPDHFRQLATGAGGPEVIDSLWRSERSWRLIILRGVIDGCAARADVSGPLPPIDDAWRLLVEAHRADQASTEKILARPQVGLWAAHTLRRLVRDDREAWPLWTDVGYLHSIAVACAVRAGLTFSLDVPAVDGTVVIPTVGSASVPRDAVMATVSSDGRRTEVTAAGVAVHAEPGDPSWRPPILIDVAANGIRLRVELMDRDPYRDVRRPSPPRPLGAGAIAKWRADLTEAWTLLAGEQRNRARAIAAGLRTLSPLPPQERFRPLSASGAEGFGGVLLSAPDNATQLAMTLVHEFQHNKLGALIHLLTLAREDSGLRYYAPWRDDPRPIGGLLQGTYAFAGITDFWRHHRGRVKADEAALANFEFALWRRQTWSVLSTLGDCDQLTDHGRQFVDTLRGQVADVRRDDVPERELAAADRMAADHRAMWGGHNIRLDRTSEAAIARAWAAGEPLPATLFEGERMRRAVLAEPDAGWFDIRAVLTRHVLAGRPAGDIRVTGATEPDVALVTGDRDRARAGYRAALIREPANVHHWIGFALSADDPADPATVTLLRRPELVLAAARNLRSPLRDPERLAAWVSLGLPPGLIEEKDPVGWEVAS